MESFAAVTGYYNAWPVVGMKWPLAGDLNWTIVSTLKGILKYIELLNN